MFIRNETMKGSDQTHRDPKAGTPQLFSGSYSLTLLYRTTKTWPFLSGIARFRYHRHQLPRTERLRELNNQETPTSAFALFYSARSHEHFDLIYLSSFAKLQNPPEGKVSELFRSKVGDFPLVNLHGNRPNLHWSGPPTPIPCASITFYGSAAFVFV